MQMTDTQETLDLRLSQVTRINSNAGERFVVSIRPALRDAGLDDVASLEFVPGETHGTLWARGIDEPVDGRKHQHRRRIRDSKKVSLPTTDVELAFDLEVGDVDDEGIPLAVHAAPGLLRFRRLGADEEIAADTFDQLLEAADRADGET